MVPLEIRELRAVQGLLEAQDLLEIKVPKDQMVNKVLKASLASQDQMGLLELVDLRVLQDQLDLLAPREMRDR